VHGGFGFYVGNPSTISAVAVPTDQGAGPFVTWGYGTVRFLWFASFLALVGMVVVRRWVWTPAVREAGMASSPAADRFREQFRRALPGAWIVLVAATALVLVFQAASVSGLSFFRALRSSILTDVLHTEFGRYWLLQALLALAIALPVFALVARRPLFGLKPQTWIAVGSILAAAECVATAANGHARTLGRAPVMVPSLALHLLAVAVWVGGLGALIVLARLAWHRVPDADRPALLRRLVRRFSQVAVVAVVVIAVTGVVNAYGDFGAISDLWRVAHGKVVAAKIVLLAVALGLAARHRWSTPKRLTQPATASGAVASFERTGAAELVAVTAAVALAAALVAMVPGRSLALAAKGPVNQEHHAGGYTVQLYVDPTALGANQIHVTFVNAKGLAAAEVSTTQVSLGPRPAPAGSLQPLAMRLISPGHFVGDTTLPARGNYELAVSTTAAPGVSTVFDFRLH
jgi:putative copper export protein